MHLIKSPDPWLQKVVVDFDFEKLDAKIFTNACGPCIGQWDRPGASEQKKNSIVHSFNRNFSKRADGNPNTHAFVTSPEMVAAIAISGDLGFNPITDTLTNKNGEQTRIYEAYRCFSFRYVFYFH